MKFPYKIAVIGLVIVSAVAGFALLLHGHPIAVLNPSGPIAKQELDLLVTATLLMLIVVVPVFVLTFMIAWKYRATNTKATYAPDWDHSRIAETTWWAVPFLLILVLSVITWRSSHDLDPFKPLASAKAPVTIQVVALQWKWLFIYPEQRIATVNFVQLPVDTPVNFVITSDAPMNSFWIPQLGGQIYAMAGMSTRLHLMATATGSYNGSSANLSGRGFSGMKFIAKASTQTDFDTWVSTVKKSPQVLDAAQYTKLALPSENNTASAYSLAQADLYDGVVMKYMKP
jgi:cytochrome o ubiquinol oxidase subunit 2